MLGRRYAKHELIGLLRSVDPPGGGHHAADLDELPRALLTLERSLAPGRVLHQSTTVKSLKPLADPLVRHVFAGGCCVPQPDFSRRDGREIVIVRPDWASAERTARFMMALIHASVMSAVRDGYAGGPGTKAIFDEAGSFMRLDRLGSYLDLARGGKIGVVYVLQSRAQLAAQPSSEEAEGLERNRAQDSGPDVRSPTRPRHRHPFWREARALHPAPPPRRDHLPDRRRWTGRIISFKP